MHTGPACLNIPELSENASDDEIVEALKRLDTAQVILSDNRREIAENAKEISAFFGQEITEEAAGNRSKQTMDSLKKTLSGITGSTGIGEL